MLFEALLTAPDKEADMPFDQEEHDRMRAEIDRASAEMAADTERQRRNRLRQERNELAAEILKRTPASSPGSEGDGQQREAMNIFGTVEAFLDERERRWGPGGWPPPAKEPTP